MPVRYCGDLRVSIKIDDTDREGWLYHCTISCPSCECGTKCKPYKVDVRLSVSERSKLVEDNPLAFDQIVKSALNFALVDLGKSDLANVLEHGAMDSAGFWVVSRKKSESWGSSE